MLCPCHSPPWYPVPLSSHRVTTLLFCPYFRAFQCVSIKLCRSNARDNQLIQRRGEFWLSVGSTVLGIDVGPRLGPVVRQLSMEGVCVEQSWEQRESGSGGGPTMPSRESPRGLPASSCTISVLPGVAACFAFPAVPHTAVPVESD